MMETYPTDTWQFKSGSSITFTGTTHDNCNTCIRNKELRQINIMLGMRPNLGVKPCPDKKERGYD